MTTLQNLSISTEMNLLGQAVDAACQVLGHSAALNGLDTHPLQDLGEPADRYILEQVRFIPGSECLLQM